MYYILFIFLQNIIFFYIWEIKFTNISIAIFIDHLKKKKIFFF